MDTTLPCWLYRSEAFAEDLDDGATADEVENSDVGQALALHGLFPRAPGRWPGVMTALAALITIGSPLWAVAAGL